jgi:hypothetical protein
MEMVDRRRQLAAFAAVAAGFALLGSTLQLHGQSQEALQIMYLKEPSLAQRRVAFLPLHMLVCPPDSAHCGYGGVDTSEEAYNNPSPLAIINEHCTAENRC